MNNVYTKRSFHIYRIENDFIVYNTNKTFKQGHTHLKSFNSAQYVIDLVLYKDIPHDLDIYRLRSLVRLAEDEEYIVKVQELIDTKVERKKAKRECPIYPSKQSKRGRGRVSR